MKEELSWQTPVRGDTAVVHPEGIPRVRGNSDRDTWCKEVI